MIEFMKEKLHVEVNDLLLENTNIQNRFYTLTHSDETGELFLFIDTKYREDKFSKHRDEVISCWKEIDNKYILEVYLCIDGEGNSSDIEKRDIIFREELSLALEAIVYGDKGIFLGNKNLIDSSIIVYFNSTSPKYNKIERWGQVSDYLIKKDRVQSNFKVPQNVTSSRLKDGVIFTLLNSYIEKEMKKIYGPRYVYCPNFSEIMMIKSLSAPLACKGRYIVVIRVRSAGINKNPVNETIIEFLISTDGVKIQSVKNPR